MFFSKRKKKEQEFVNQINAIISETDYRIVLYKKFYKAYGDILLKLVAPKKMNIKLSTDRGDVVLNERVILLGNKEKSVDENIIYVVSKIFAIIKCDDWRLTGQEQYMLFSKLVEIVPCEYISKLTDPTSFHEHCEFCMEKIEESDMSRHYYTTNQYSWICEQCYNDFKEMFGFTLIKEHSNDNLFKTFNSINERRIYGGSAFIELQFCKMEEGTSIKKIISVNNVTHWKDDSLYIYMEDIDVFINEYNDIFDCGIYHNLNSGVIDICGINYYSKEIVLNLIEKVKNKKPKDYEILIVWLEKSRNYNGFYFLGI